jgi:heme exporter protein D
MNGVLAMGGYAAFVWPAYAVSIVGLGGLIVWTLASYARAKRRAQTLGRP